MGLTTSSTGIKASNNELKIEKLYETDKVVALAGNPNVGKSTVFNALTGLKQHTGNWPGKTVTNAQGRFEHKGNGFIMVDLPGTYSLMAHSTEEEVARDFVCFQNPDAVVVVTDATCLERNLNLVLQTAEISNNVIVCVNLLDEAKKKQIQIDLSLLSEQIGLPVVGTSARSKKGLKKLIEIVSETTKNNNSTTPIKRIRYTKPIEAAIELLQPRLTELLDGKLNPRWVALRLLDSDFTLINSINSYLGITLLDDKELFDLLTSAKSILLNNGIEENRIKDIIVSCIVLRSEEICNDAVRFENACYNAKDRKIDKILTSKLWGFPIMIGLLAAIFWLTITGANYPSQMLSKGLFYIEDRLTDLFTYLNAPNWLHGILVTGMYRTLAWVVSVMLPPMAIFFPLFTLLEDLGYLPRVAFNLDKYFKKANACGKQSLTMCMGFGCNAAGIIGCRIIDSPRERLIAIITNNFVPCNGRFPTLIAIITMFFASYAVTSSQSIISTLILTAFILLGIIVTLLVSKLLSKTILKGVPSSFTLELPPYRKPQVGSIILRSILDRTIYVLGRAIAVAAPAGIIIWIMANITVGDMSILNHCAAFFDPFAKLIGLDGFILMAFILGFPANEIVIPIIIMSYMATGSMMELESLTELKALLVQNGWTSITAICTMLFSLMHFPCSTTCLTIQKETKSFKWTAISFIVPTIIGIVACFIVATIGRLLGIS